MNQEEIKLKYPINKEYLISDFGSEDKIEKVVLQKVDGIIAFVEYIERPLLHPFRYGQVKIFRLKSLNN